MGDLGSRLKWEFNDPNQDSSAGVGEVGEDLEVNRVVMGESHFVEYQALLDQTLSRGRSESIIFLKLINISSSR